MASIMQWNCRGYFPNYEEIMSLIRHYNPEVVVLQETMIGNYSPKSTSGYTFYGFSPAGRSLPGDGLAFLIKNNVAHRQITITSNMQVFAFQVRLKRLYTICNIYVTNHDNLSPVQLDHIINQLPSPFVLCGDFNARNALWGDSAVNGRGNAVEQFIVNSDAVLLNTGSQTHFHVQTGTSSAIDLTVVSSEVAADFLWEVDEDLHGSDHFPIIIYEIEALPAIREPRFIEQRANWEDFREATEMIDRWDGCFR